MNLSRARKWTLVFLVVVLLIPTLACAELERAVEEEVERQREELERQAEETARSWLDQQVETLKETWNQFWQDIQAHLGIVVPEVPETVGTMAPELAGQVEADKVRIAYLEAFKELGGVGKIGQPTDLVHDWEGVLVQSFQRGDQLTLILMDRYSRSAYGISGPWLERYRALGGPEKAGWPVSNVERWGYPSWFLLWSSGKGRVQRFQDPGSRRYGLMWADGAETIHLVPPLFWDVYNEQSGPTDLGYPVSSYPLAEQDIQAMPALSELEQNMLQIFSDQPQRTVVFQRGAIVVDMNSGASEILHKQELNGGENKLLLGALGVLADKFWSEIGDPSQTSSCDYLTFSSAATATRNEFVGKMMKVISLIPLKSALTVAEAETWAGKLLLGATNWLLDMVGEEDPAPSFLSAFGGQVVGIIYPHLFGDILALPMGVAVDASVERAIQESYDHMKETLMVSLEIEADQYISQLGETTGTTTLIAYNPYTHFVTIIIRADCSNELYVVQYRADDEASPADQTTTWEGIPYFWKLPGEHF